jgi:hypothetical protein
MGVASFLSNISSTVRNKIKNPITIAPTSPEKHTAFFLKLKNVNITVAMSRDNMNSIGIHGVTI